MPGARQPPPRAGLSRHPLVTTTTGCLGIAAVIVVATLISIWYFNTRPDRIRLTQGGREARLLSVVGRILYPWTAEVDGGIAFAELVDQSAELGGRRLALLGYSVAPSNPFPGMLCAFDVERSYDTPVWTQGIDTRDILPSLIEEDFVGADFGISTCKLANVFPERPGHEIVALHGHRPYSACVIRIYDLSGKVLYQMWHDGILNEC